MGRGDVIRRRLCRADWTRIGAACLLLSACGGGRTHEGTTVQPPVSVTALPQVVEIVFLEADRHAGRARLAELVDYNSPEVRACAVRGLGRIGDDASEETLELAMSDAPEDLQADIAAAMGLVGAVSAERRLLGAFERSESSATRIAIARALGRLGTSAALEVLTAAVRDPDAGVAEAGGIALGMLGRREIALDDAARAALLEASRHAEVTVRYGATYGLAHAHRPVAAASVLTALDARVGQEDDAEIRALAVLGLGRRGAFESLAVEAALKDRDWRVRVAALRALSGDEAPPASRAAVAVSLVREWALLTKDGMTGPAAHALDVGLTALGPFATDDATRKTARMLHEAAGKVMGKGRSPPPPASTVHCRAAALLVRAGAEIDTLRRCGSGSAYALDLRFELEAQLLAEGEAAPGEARIDAAEALAARKELSARMAAVRAAVGIFRDATASVPTRQQAAAILTRALSSADPALSGTAAEVIATLAAVPEEREAAAALMPALAARAGKAAYPADIELLASAIEAFRASAVAAGQPVCAAALEHPNMGIREAARSCMEALTGVRPPASEPDAPARPPVSPAPLLGKEVLWRLETTRGTLTIALDPDTAPWHVAAIVSMVEQELYDGLPWHRVVPGFVTQGGDPTGTGWGGPGFLVPTEASWQPFVRGAVGIADAGKDTGGSQIFLMHARAPHLEGRYTHVGQVREGLETLDALTRGDRIVDSSIEVRARR